MNTAAQLYLDAPVASYEQIHLPKRTILTSAAELTQHTYGIARARARG
jgi:hypothetical protein